MAYAKTTWATGDVITAEKLNNIEAGVSANLSDYSKTNWSNGDVITATKLNNAENGVASIDATVDSVISRTITSFSSDTLTSIGDGAFYDCSALTTVDFPAATSIGENAFSDCSALTTVDFPLVTSIGSEAFANSSSLTTVILRKNQVATLANTNAFTNANNAIIYVPDDLVASYKADTNWSSLASRIKCISELPTA